MYFFLFFLLLFSALSSSILLPFNCNAYRTQSRVQTSKVNSITDQTSNSRTFLDANKFTHSFKHSNSLSHSSIYPEVNSNNLFDFEHSSYLQHKLNLQTNHDIRIRSTSESLLVKNKQSHQYNPNDPLPFDRRKKRTLSSKQSNGIKSKREEFTQTSIVANISEYESVPSISNVCPLSLDEPCCWTFGFLFDKFYNWVGLNQAWRRCPANCMERLADKYNISKEANNIPLYGSGQEIANTKYFN